MRIIKGKCDNFIIQINVLTAPNAPDFQVHGKGSSTSGIYVWILYYGTHTIITVNSQSTPNTPNSPVQGEGGRCSLQLCMYVHTIITVNAQSTPNALDSPVW